MRSQDGEAPGPPSTATKPAFTCKFILTNCERDVYRYTLRAVLYFRQGRLERVCTISTWNIWYRSHDVPAAKPAWTVGTVRHHKIIKCLFKPAYRSHCWVQIFMSKLVSVNSMHCWASQYCISICIIKGTRQWATNAGRCLLNFLCKKLPVSVIRRIDVRTGNMMSRLLTVSLIQLCVLVIQGVIVGKFWAYSQRIKELFIQNFFIKLSKTCIWVQRSEIRDPGKNLIPVLRSGGPKGTGYRIRNTG
jgi:hypothetical protein